MKTAISLQIKATSEITENDIIDIVGRNKFEQIKQNSPGGIFKAWVICHEGESRPRIVGKGQRKVHWPKRAVKSAFDKIANGLKFFHRHNTDNSTRDREPFGEVVGKEYRRIDGKDSAIVIGHFPEEKREIAEKSDVISMEAIWNMAEDLKNLIAEGVEKFTGIALGNSYTDKPAFPGATQLSTVQCFGDEPEPPPRPPQHFRSEKPSFSDFRWAIQHYQIKPTHMFGLDEILGKIRTDKEGVLHFDGDGDREVITAIREQISGHFIDQIKGLREQLKESQLAAKSANNKLAVHDARPALEKLADEMKVTPTAKLLALGNMDKLEIGEDPAASMKTFLENQIKEDERMSKVYGTSPAAAPPQERPNLGGDGNKDKNPFLEEGEQ